MKYRLKVSCALRAQGNFTNCTLSFIHFDKFRYIKQALYQASGPYSASSSAVLSSMSSESSSQRV